MKVIIIGAGSAGLASAYKLAQSGKNFEILLIEKGRAIKSRKCAVKSGGKCLNCKPCNIASGIGGAGLFSDGKLLYSTIIGTNLPELIGRAKTQEYIDEAEKLFSTYGAVTAPRKTSEERMLETKAAQNGIQYIGSKQTHVGSDKLPAVIGEVVKGFSNRVKIIHEEVLDIGVSAVKTDKGEHKYDRLIIALGRGGADQIEAFAKKLKIDYSYNPIDIGVRVEVPDSIMEYVCSVNWDFKARMRLSNDDLVRTFCVCPRGFVTKEDYPTYNLVNGHSQKNIKSPNTNFAFLIKWQLTAPVKNANTYGIKVAEEVTFTGGGKPIIQRLGDLRAKRRSNPERISRSYITPTLTDVTPGDIGMALGYRFVSGLMEGLDRLERLVPGIAADHTLLYAPEIKFHGIKIKTNERLESSVKGIYFAGDASGYSRGIVGAAATGFLAADGIIKKGDG